MKGGKYMKNLKIVSLVRFGFIEAGMLFVIMSGICQGVILGNLDIRKGSDNYAVGKMWITIYGIVGLLLITIAAILIIRTLKRRLYALDDCARKVVEGRTDVDIVKETDDDIGVVVDEFRRLIAASADQAAIAREIANGNLVLDIRPRSDKDVLGNALKEVVEVNNKVLSGIKESSMQLTTGAAQVADASQALAQGSTEQASAIEQITASMEDISDKVSDNADDVSRADVLIHDMEDGTNQGMQQMKDLSAAMEQISQSSNSISKVIKVIDDIAFQTNILALNATVEAARAGVHGKGFAVVAEEVRNLAEKSAQAAHETAELIQSSMEKVNEGSRTTGEVKSAISMTKDAVAQMVGIVDKISQASSEQATAVAQVKQAITQVSQVVQTNSATSEECASASEELSNQAQALRNMISRFRLKSDTDNMSINWNRNGTSSVQGYSDGYAYSTADAYVSGVNHRGYAGSDNEKIISLDGDFGKY